MPVRRPYGREASSLIRPHLQVLKFIIVIHRGFSPLFECNNCTTLCVHGATKQARPSDSFLGPRVRSYSVAGTTLAKKRGQKRKQQQPQPQCSSSSASTRLLNLPSIWFHDLLVLFGCNTNASKTSHNRHRLEIHNSHSCTSSCMAKHILTETTV